MGLFRVEFVPATVADHHPHHDRPDRSEIPRKTPLSQILPAALRARRTGYGNAGRLPLETRNGFPANRADIRGFGNFLGTIGARLHANLTRWIGTGDSTRRSFRLAFPPGKTRTRQDSPNGAGVSFLIHNVFGRVLPRSYQIGVLTSQISRCEMIG